MKLTQDQINEFMLEEIERKVDGLIEENKILKAKLREILNEG